VIFVPYLEISEWSVSSSTKPACKVRFASYLEISGWSVSDPIKPTCKMRFAPYQEISPKNLVRHVRSEF